MFVYSKKNIANKNMQHAYYLETNPSHIGLIVLIVQSRTPLHVFKTIRYLIFNPKTCKLFTYFSLYKFKLILQV